MSPRCSKRETQLPLGDSERDLPPTQKDALPSASPTLSTAHTSPDASKLDSTLESPGDLHSSALLDAELPEGQMPAPGHRLGDYRFLEVLGSGAFATVYVAEQISLGRKVALKVGNNKDTEAITLAHLEHEHIVPVIEEIVDAERNLRLLCMKLVPGTDLEHVFKEMITRPRNEWSGKAILDVVDKNAKGKAKFDLAAIRARETLEQSDYAEAVCWIGARLAEALAHAHSRGVLHRDIKPANVLLDAYGRPLLSDFNLAACTHRNLGKDQIGGTIRYMAPEHLDAFNPSTGVPREAVDERSDVYSLGVVLYELLTGQVLVGESSLLPFGFERISAMAEERRRPPPSLREHNPSLSVTVDRVVRRCLAPDPDQRYQNAEDLVLALEGARELRHVERALPAPLTLTKLSLARPALMFLLLAFLPHLLGSAVNITYNSQAIVTRLSPVQQQSFQHVMLAYNVLIYPLCLWIVCRKVVPIFRFRRRLTGPEPVSAEEAEAVRGRSLTLPIWIVVLSCVGWLPGGLLFPLAIHLTSEPLSIGIFGHFLFSFTVSGLIAATYSYFGIQFFVVRILYPYLWVDPRSPRSVARRELGSLEGRQRFFQFIAGLIPLSGAMLVLLLGPNEQFSVMFRLLVVALISLGMAGFGAALAVSGQVSGTVSVLMGGTQQSK